jgi:plasmid stabilization system protein ParE
VSRVELSPRARQQARRIDVWWRANRLAAPDLFAQELIRALEQLAEMPHLGMPYEYPGSFPVRRVLLSRSRYHVYFSFEPEKGLLKVRAIWHAARGRGPLLE